MTIKSTIAIIGFGFSIAVFASCNTPTEKINQAKNDVAKANQELENAKKEYVADVATYKIKIDEKIAASRKSMLEFNVRISNEKATTKKAFQKRLAELEQRESNLKKKMDDYKMDGQENWIIFKTEFNQDMEDLEKALKDLTAKNTGQQTLRK